MRRSRRHVLRTAHSRLRRTSGPARTRLLGCRRRGKGRALARTGGRAPPGTQGTRQQKAGPTPSSGMRPGKRCTASAPRGALSGCDHSTQTSVSLTIRIRLASPPAARRAVAMTAGWTRSVLIGPLRDRALRLVDAARRSFLARRASFSAWSRRSHSSAARWAGVENCFARLGSIMCTQS
jgi:hypothetical protein